MMTHTLFRSRALLLSLSWLMACGVSNPPQAIAPSPTPVVTQARVLGSLAIGLGDSAAAQSRALGDDLASFTRVANGTFDVGTERYFYARFQVHNTTTVAFNNLTVYAQHQRTATGVAVSLAQTAFKSIRNAGNAPITDAAVLRSIAPSQRVQLVGASLEQVDADADFQAVTPLEASTIEGEALSRGVILPFDQILEYGFVARNASGGRTIAAGADGQMTLTFKLPINPDPTLVPAGFILNAVIADVSLGRVTRGELETTAHAEARASAIGGISELALLGTDDAVSAGFHKIYRPQLERWYNASAESTRDPWLQPFNRQSIWNMPLGANAKIQSLGYFNPGTAFPAGFHGFGADTELHFQLRASDPLRNLYDPLGWTKRCGGTNQQSPGFQMRIADDWLIADAINTPTQFSTPNNVSSFLQPDRETVFELEPLARCPGDPNVYGYRNTAHPEANLRLDTGNYGTHFGSGLAGFGGSLRHGDLTSSSPIQHALHFNAWGKQFLHYSAGDPSPGYRWPADRADGGAASGPNAYGGSDPKIEQGALLAIPATTNLSMKTAAGAKMLAALKTYGAYITDDTGWDHYDWGVSKEAVEEFREVNGYDFGQGASASGPAKDWYDDVVALMAALGVVDDNAVNNIGGAGARLAPLTTAEYAPFDLDPPTAPSDLAVSNTGVASLRLDWSASGDAHRVVRYDVLDASDALVASTYGSTSATIQDLTPNTAYSLKVRAVDGNNNISPSSGSVSASTKIGYAANFGGSSQPGWSLSGHSSVADGVLHQGDWCCTGETSLYGLAVTSGSYTLESDFIAYGTAGSNEGWMYFNYQDANNYYALLTNGGTGNNTSLIKAVGGTVSVLGSSAYSFTSNAHVRIVYTDPGATSRTISVSVSRNGSSLTLFSNVADNELNAGTFGFGSSNNKVTADNLTLEGSLVVPRFFNHTFTGNSAPNWTLSAGSVYEYDHLKTGSFGAADSSLHPGPNNESYTFSTDLELYGNGYYNEGYVYFNASDTNNAYALHFNGSGSSAAADVMPNIVELVKIVAGSSTVLGSVPSGYSFQGSGGHVKIGYDATTRHITVQASRAGVTRTLFDLTDATYSGGQVGFGSRYSALIADNTEVKAGLDLAISVFTSNFDAPSDPSWTLLDANSLFQYGRLRVGNYGAFSSALHAGTSAGSFVFSSDLFTYASGGNPNFVFFNYQDASNCYVLEITSETSNNSLTLKKLVAGVSTVLATTSNYPLQASARLTVHYDAVAQTISIEAKRGGVSTSLFNAVSDASFTAGSVGFGAQSGQLDVDNVSLAQ